jgi:hypothetical protein
MACADGVVLNILIAPSQVRSTYAAAKTRPASKAPRPQIRAPSRLTPTFKASQFSLRWRCSAGIHADVLGMLDFGGPQMVSRSWFPVVLFLRSLVSAVRGRLNFGLVKLRCVALVLNHECDHKVQHGDGRVHRSLTSRLDLEGEFCFSRQRIRSSDVDQKHRERALPAHGSCVDHDRVKLWFFHHSRSLR